MISQLSVLIGKSLQWVLKGNTPDKLFGEKVLQTDYTKVKKVGRNDPCQYGSGLKYIKCFGR